MTPRETAGLIGVSVETLRNWRSQHRGPPYYKLGAITYWSRDVEGWIASRRVQPRSAS
jgi:hypothetical protein